MIINEIVVLLLTLFRTILIQQISEKLCINLGQNFKLFGECVSYNYKRNMSNKNYILKEKKKKFQFKFYTNFNTNAS